MNLSCGSARVFFFYAGEYPFNDLYMTNAVYA